MDIKKIRKALGTSTKLKQDECEDWNLFGTKGKIYHDHIYWYVMVYNPRELDQKLNFMTKWQGDGIYRSDKLPSSEEALLVRKLIGLGKKRTLSPQEREKAILRLQNFSYEHAPKVPVEVH